MILKMFERTLYNFGSAGEGAPSPPVDNI